MEDHIPKTVTDLRRRPEVVMAHLREETAIKMAYKLLLEGTKIIATT